MYRVFHHIGGKNDTDDKNTSHTLYNPASGEAIGNLAFADQKTCDTAIDTAKKAFETWRETSLIKRTHILFKFRELLEKHQQELMQIVSREHGKTYADAKGSIARGIEVVEYYCGILSQLKGAFTAEVSEDIDCYTLRQPLGISVGISPFNFPVMVPLWMMVPAIACGNTFILKPSEQDPSAPIRLMELFEDAGLPPGVVNGVHGDKHTVEYLISHPFVATCTAVASTPVAKAIYTTAIAHGKRAHTFGGAKNHCIVMPDADLESTSRAIVAAAYGSAGERCMAISVVVVVGEVTANQLRTRLHPLIQAIKIDRGEKPDTDMGPLISAAHKKRVIQAIDDGVAEGASLVIDGRSFQHPTEPKGYFLGPTLFDEVKEPMSIYQNEIFGPVLVIMRVQDFEEALALVNRNQYGNGTAIFTNDGYIAREYSQRVEVGMVGINIPIPVPIASHPFGGWKHSCFGDTNMHGLESIHFYTRLKTITCRWTRHKMIVSTFNMPTHN